MNHTPIWVGIICLAGIMGLLEFSHIKFHMTEKRPNYHLHKIQVVR